MKLRNYDRLDREAIRELGRWFDSLYLWDWFVTLTFKKPTGVKRANKVWWIWIRKLINASPARIEFVRVRGFQQRGIIHYHAVMAGTKDLEVQGFIKIWKELGGLAKIEGFVGSRGGCYYLAKHTQGELSDLQFSPGLKGLPNHHPALGM